MKSKAIRQSENVDSILYCNEGPQPFGVGYLKGKLIHWKITPENAFKAVPVSIKKAAEVMKQMLLDEMKNTEGYCLQNTSRGQLQWVQDVSRALQSHAA